MSYSNPMHLLLKRLLPPPGLQPEQSAAVDEQALEEIAGLADAGPALITALHESSLSKAAAEAIIRLPRLCLLPLTAMLEEDRCDICQALGCSAYLRILMPIWNSAVQEDDREVQQNMLSSTVPVLIRCERRILCSSGRTGLQTVLSTILSTQMRDGESGQPRLVITRPDVLESLRTELPEGPWDALLTLERSGVAALPQFIRQLHRAPMVFYEPLGRVLGSLGEAALELLLGGLTNPEPMAWRTCAFALGFLGKPAVRGLIAAHEATHNLMLRMEIERALASMGTEGIEPMIEALEEGVSSDCLTSLITILRQVNPRLSERLHQALLTAAARYPQDRMLAWRVDCLVSVLTEA